MPKVFFRRIKTNFPIIFPTILKQVHLYLIVQLSAKEGSLFIYLNNCNFKTDYLNLASSMTN